MGDVDILRTVAATIVLGVTGQILASATRMPAIIFLLVLGVLAGPGVAGLVNPEVLGQAGLSTIISAFVAIILFEGGLTLTPKVLKEALQPVRRLVSLGAAVTLFGGAAMARYTVGMPWSYAFLFGSLIIVTGPTVISPILRRVRLGARVQAVLRSESILIDPIGAIIAIVALQYVSSLLTAEEATLGTAISGFFLRSGIGIVVGVLAAGVALLASRVKLFHNHENQHLVNLGALGIAFGAYAVSENLISESGVMAATVAGLVLAAARLPFREELENFKEQLTTLGVSVLFILLAANVDLGELSQTGWPEILLLLGIMFIVRPLSVIVSTIGTKLNWRERAYLSLMAPRGIIAAAMAGYFAQHLGHVADGMGAGNADIAGIGRRIETLVFLTIAVTVFIQGLWASPLAKLFMVAADRPTGVLLVGVNQWSLALGDVLKSHGVIVQFLDSNPMKCEVARERGFEVEAIDATNHRAYDELDLSRVGSLVAMTPNDAINTLACDEAKDVLGATQVFQILSKPVGATNRSRVRQAGQWAMPTGLSHHAVCSLLQHGQLYTATEAVEEPTRVDHHLRTAQGPMVPLAILLPGGKLRLAVEGEVCPPGGSIVGLVESPARGEAEDSRLEPSMLTHAGVDQRSGG